MQTTSLMNRKDLKAKPTTIYLPAELRERIEAQAHAETRSVSQMIVHLLQQHYTKEEESK